ncbi:MAG TPA: hypothetical protein VLW86_13575 [Syntrophorhabdales bacterium]|nr:hypothetical protein [Syntrophorhabdales bacterium]
MAIMDDFVKKTGEGLKTLKETAEGIALNVERQARVAARKMDIMRIQKRIQKTYGEIGEHVYREHAAGRPAVVEFPFLKERLAAVSQLKSEIARIEEEIAMIRDVQAPMRDEPPEEDERRI